MNNKVLIYLVLVVCFLPIVFSATLQEHNWNAGNDTNLRVVADTDTLDANNPVYSNGKVRLGDNNNGAGADHTRLYNTTFTINYSMTVETVFNFTTTNGYVGFYFMTDPEAVSWYGAGEGVFVYFDNAGNAISLYNSGGANCGAADTLGTFTHQATNNYRALINFSNVSGNQGINLTLYYGNGTVAISNGAGNDPCVSATQQWNYGMGSVNNDGGYFEVDLFRINDTSPSVQQNTTVNFTAVDDFNGSIVESFAINLTWSNGTVETSIPGVNGGAFLNLGLNNVSLTVNVTYWNITDYYDLVLFDQIVLANNTNTVQGNVYQAVINMVALEKVSGNTVSGGTFHLSDKTGVVFNVTADNHSINFTHPIYYDLNITNFTVSALTNTTLNVTGVYSSVVNITAFRANTSLLTNWDIQITSLTYPNWTGENTTTTNGTVWFNAVNGTYQGIINSSLGTETFTFVVDGLTENISYFFFDMDNCSFYTNTVLNFTIKREIDSVLLDDSDFDIWFNVSSSLFSGFKQFNFSFSVGNNYSICVPSNSISNFTAYAQATYSNLPTYAEKNYYLVDFPLNTTEQKIDLFLTNGTSQVKLQVRDSNDDGVSNVIVKVLSYDVGTNSYTTTEILSTDSEGDAYAQLILNTEWYAFLLEQDGLVILQTLPTKITSTTVTLRVNLDVDYMSVYNVAQGITNILSFNNATTSFSFTWSDPTNTMTEACLSITRRSINGETLLNTTCVSSAAGTLLMNISEAVGTNTYVANSYAVISGNTIGLQSLSVNFDNTYRIFGASGLFFSGLIMITLVLISLWHPVAAIVSMVVAVIFTNAMGLFYMNWTYIVTFIILAGITIYRTGRSE